MWKRGGPILDEWTRVIKPIDRKLFGVKSSIRADNFPASSAYR